MKRKELEDLFETWNDSKIGTTIANKPVLPQTKPQDVEKPQPSTMQTETPPPIVKPSDQIRSGDLLMTSDHGKKGTSSDGYVYDTRTGHTWLDGKAVATEKYFTKKTTKDIPEDLQEAALVVGALPIDVDFSDWDSLTTKQQLKMLELAGLTKEQMDVVLNVSPHYVKTLGTIRDIRTNRTYYGLTQAEADKLVKELLAIAKERDDLLYHSDFVANTPRSADIMKGMLNDREAAVLAKLEHDDSVLWYNENQPANSEAGGGSDYLRSSRPRLPISMTHEGENVDEGGFIDVPSTPFYDLVNAVNCYGYALMYLGIEPKYGNYNLEPGDISFSNDGVYGDNNDQYVQIVANRVIKDMKQSGGDARIINSTTDAEDGEIVVAVKTRYILFNDFHIAVLLPDGTWADKQGTIHDSTKSRIENPDDDWPAGWLSRPYDSDTIYIAVAPPKANE
jgi:hypothetical protein